VGDLTLLAGTNSPVESLYLDNVDSLVDPHEDIDTPVATSRLAVLHPISVLREERRHDSFQEVAPVRSPVNWSSHDRYSYSTLCSSAVSAPKTERGAQRYLRPLLRAAAGAVSGYPFTIRDTRTTR
jgi:hypothetical protein